LRPPDVGGRIAEVVCKYSPAFFDRQLNGDQDAQKALSQKDEMISLFPAAMD